MKETQAQWKRQEAQETGTMKTNSAESSHCSVSDSRRLLVKVGGPCPYGWKDIWLTISCFLFPQISFEQVSWQCVQLKDSGRDCSPMCPKASIISCALVTVAQVGSTLLNLLCAKDQANENCGHRSGI